MKHEQDLIDFLQQDAELMNHLRTVATLQLPDWWICAGYIRAKIWDHLHGYNAPTQTDDVDVIYFDPTQSEESIEKELEQKLHQLNPDVPWSVKNQARMHHVNHLPPYTSSIDALAHFPETVTAIGVRLNVDGELILSAPYGVQDLLTLQARPTPYFETSTLKHPIYLKRMVQKNWPAQWPNVKLYTSSLH